MIRKSQIIILKNKYLLELHLIMQNLYPLYLNLS